MRRSARTGLRLPNLHDVMRGTLPPTDEVDLRGMPPCEVFGRLCVPERTYLIDLDVYLHFLDGRPFVMGNRCFVPGWHADLTRILWAQGRRYYSRQLTAEEAVRLHDVIDA